MTVYIKFDYYDTGIEAVNSPRPWNIVDLTHLEEHFDREEDGEDVVDVAEDGVAETGAVDGVLGGQRDAAGTDDGDDERVE